MTMSASVIIRVWARDSRAFRRSGTRTLTRTCTRRCAPQGDSATEPPAVSGVKKRPDYMDVGRLVCDVRYSSRCVAPVSRDTAPGPARTVCLFCVLMMMSRGPPICGDRCGMQAWVASWSLRTLFSSCSFSRPESSWREEGDGRGDFWGVTITGTGDRFDSRRGRVEASRRGEGEGESEGPGARADSTAVVIADRVRGPGGKQV